MCKWGQTDKTPAEKSLYRPIFLDNDIWHCFLSVNLSTTVSLWIVVQLFFTWQKWSCSQWTVRRSQVRTGSFPADPLWLSCVRGRGCAGLAQSSSSPAAPSRSGHHLCTLPASYSLHLGHRLNMEVDLQSFIWAPCHVMCTAVLTASLFPPIWAQKTRDVIGQP